MVIVAWKVRWRRTRGRRVEGEARKVKVGWEGRRTSENGGTLTQGRAKKRRARSWLTFTVCFVCILYLRS